MPKLLRGQDRLLLSLSLIGDLLDLTVGAGHRAYHYRRLGLYFPPGYKAFNLNNTVRRSLKTGNIEKTINKQKRVCIKLTSQGNSQLERSFPLYKLQNKKWDGHWRLVTFDIQESHKRIRDLLRRKLQSLNFAKFQKSIYISPHNFAEDLLEFLKFHHFHQQAFILEVNHKYLPHPKEFSASLWPINQLQDKYQLLLDKLNQKSITQIDINKISDQYLGLLCQDPHLPKELLPHNWPEPHIRKSLSQLIINQK